MKKVLLIGYTYPGIGGIERSFEILSKYLKNFDYEVKIIAAQSKTKEDKEVIYFKKSFLNKLLLLEPLVTYQAFKHFFNNNLNMMNNNILVVRHLPISYLLSCIHQKHVFIPPCVSNDFFDGILDAINKEKNIKKYLKLIKWNLTKKIYNYFEQKVLESKITDIWTFSNNVKENLEQYYYVTKNIQVHPPGIDLNNFYTLDKNDLIETKEELNIDENDFVILYVGRLSAGKNIDILIEAFDVLDIVNKKLVLVGTGHYDFTKKENIILTGKKSLEELKYYYNSSNLLVLPTTHEGFGQVLIEALGCGTPIIGFDSPHNAMDEILIDDLFGFSTKDLTVNGLVEAINRLYLKKDYYSKNRKNIERYAKKYFSWDSFIEKVIINDKI